MALNVSSNNAANLNSLLPGAAQATNANANAGATGTSAYEALAAALDDDKKQSQEDEVILSDAATAAAEEESEAKPAGAAACKTAAQYRAYLKENYACMRGGNVKVAKEYLEQCLKDPEAAADFELYLKKIPETEKIVGENAEKENSTLLHVNWTFDKNGKLSSVTVLKNNVAQLNGSSQLIDSLGGNRNGASSLLSLMQAAIGAEANISIKYSNAGTAATAANSEAFRKLDLLA